MTFQIASAFQADAGDPGSWANMVNDIIFVVAVLISAFLLTRIVRYSFKTGLGLVARRSRRGARSFWLTRIPRLLGETDSIASLRRDQRVTATATMLSRITNVVVWLLAILVILAGLEVDVVWALSSAGFLGAAVAIGGQHSVHDYLNGLHILLEDRFGEGDTIEITAPVGTIRTGTVERLGTFSTRLKGDAATWHISNRLLAEINNLSQHASQLDLDITTTQLVEPHQVQRALQQTLSDSDQISGTAHTVVVDTVELTGDDRAARHGYRIKGRTTAAVSTAQHGALAGDLAQRLAQ